MRYLNDEPSINQSIMLQPSLCCAAHLCTRWWFVFFRLASRVHVVCQRSGTQAERWSYESEKFDDSLLRYLTMCSAAST